MGRVLLHASCVKMGNGIFRVAMRLGWLARAAFVFGAVVSRQSSVVSRQSVFSIFAATLLGLSASGQECPLHTDCGSFFLRLYLFLFARGQPEKF